MKARLLDDRADARKRRGALCGHGMPEHAHAARACAREPQQHADHRGLAGAVGPKEAKGAAARDLQIDTVDRGTLTEALGQAGGLDRRPS